MRVRMLTMAAGPGGVFPSGSIRDLPDGEAYALIEGRYAEQIETAQARQTETATAQTDETGDAAGGETRNQIDLSKLSKADLVEYAESMFGLKLDPKAKHAEMVEQIETAQAKA